MLAATADQEQELTRRGWEPPWQEGSTALFREAPLSGAPKLALAMVRALQTLGCEVAGVDVQLTREEPEPPSRGGYLRVTRGARSRCRGTDLVGRDPVRRVSCLSRAAFGLSAFVSAGALVVLSAAPGAAATPVAQASAAAISLTIGGQAVDAGSYRVTNDGTREDATGTNKPALSLLGGQSLVKAGTLAQDASTSVVNSQGRSRACAGLAGQGASVIGVGNGGSCFVPGQAVTIGAGSLDLSGLQIVQSAFLQGFDAQAQLALQPILQPLTAALQTGLQQAVAALGLDVGIELGAVESSCTAEPGSASGSARLVGSKAYITVGGQRITLVDLPADPAPNTHVVGDLGQVATLVETAVQTQLNAVLSNLPGGVVLPPLVDQAAALNAALASLGQQLKPLQDNVIDVVLNKQTKASPDQIEVTALDLSLLPVAQQFGVTAFNLKIGTSACGPSGKVAAARALADAGPQGQPEAAGAHRGPRRARPPPATAPAGAGRDRGGALALAAWSWLGVGAAGALGHRVAVRRR